MFEPDGLDLGDLLKQSQQRMAGLAAVREQMAHLKGRAESEDGRISVTSTPDDPLAEIKIDPRAMRTRPGAPARTSTRRCTSSPPTSTATARTRWTRSRTKRC
ncbi:hypothetical protein GCM10009736_46300 [Actinomadura bangladeshensis]